MTKFFSVMTMAKEVGAKYISFRFTDMKGTWQHLSYHIHAVDEDLLTTGIMFDGSSIVGWKHINESDMLLAPRAESAMLDPFADDPTIILNCDVMEPQTGELYSRGPRGIAKMAEEYLIASGIGDTAYFGPEPEFFVFDSVRFAVEPNRTFYELDSEEGPYNSGKDYPDGNLAHRPRTKSGYFPVPPVDHGLAMRDQMLDVLFKMGVEVEKHHHEVAPSQHELGIRYNTLVRCADNVQKYKYVVHNVAQSRGKTATFMPKPVMQDNGSGMHVHQSIWKDGRSLFSGDLYDGLSEVALHYIGGIIKHGKALNAFTNPTTNSYKRLVPGYEAPVFLCYSARNRSAACRIPYVASPNGKRVEVRFPDAAANPYLAFAAMLMAGLDGIENKIHPGDAMDQNLFDMKENEIQYLPTVCGSLREAIRVLKIDNEFLRKGEVFRDDMIDSYMHLKRQELHAYETATHPVEFDMYYSV